MDLADLRLFVRVAEQASFTRGGEQLGLSRARSSLRVRALEEELGASLFHRSTRVVRLTAEGEALLARARPLLAECEEVEALFHPAQKLRGAVRVDLPVNFACEVVLPRLPEFLARHPQLELVLSATDRRTDVLREGFDCVLRVGALTDSSLVARRLGAMPVLNWASRRYLERHGVPRTPEELGAHLLVHYTSGWPQERPSFEYLQGGRVREVPMRSAVTVNSTDAYRAACFAGLGLIQAPRGKALVEAQARGEVQEVLAAYRCAPMPVSLLHAHGARVPARVRAVLEWLTEVMAPQLRTLVDPPGRQGGRGPRAARER